MILFEERVPKTEDQNFSVSKFVLISRSCQGFRKATQSNLRFVTFTLWSPFLNSSALRKLQSGLRFETEKMWMFTGGMIKFCVANSTSAGAVWLIWDTLKNNMKWTILRPSFKYKGVFFWHQKCSSSDSFQKAALVKPKVWDEGNSQTLKTLSWFSTQITYNLLYFDSEIILVGKLMCPVEE